MADGPGLRTSIYCAGCQHHCPGCHNPQSWNIDNGRWMDVDDLFELIVSDEISNVTFTGGDPFYQAEAFTELARRIKAETKKNIWTMSTLWSTGLFLSNRGILRCFSEGLLTSASFTSPRKKRISAPAQWNS